MSLHDIDFYINIWIMYDLFAIPEAMYIIYLAIIDLENDLNP